MQKNYDISCDSILKKVNKQILKLGLRHSAKRNYIIKALFFSTEHLTVEQIILRVKNKYKINLGIATAYRNINLLEDLNFVKSLDINDGFKRYILNIDLNNDHLICNSCCKIFEFTNDIIKKERNKILKKHNFTFDNHTMTIYGLCENCQ